MRSGRWNGSGSRSTPSTALKMVVVDPIPTASVSTAAIVNPGARRRVRAAYRRSPAKSWSNPILACCHDSIDRLPNGQDDLPGGVGPAGEHLVRRARIVERQDAADASSEAAVVEEISQRLEAPGRHVDDEERFPYTRMLAGLWERRHDRHQHPTRFQHTIRALDCVATDGIEHEVERRHGVLESRRAVVDDVRRAQAFDVWNVGAGGGDEYLEPSQPRELDGV